MAMSQSEARRAAMKAFEESLSQLQNTLQSEAPDSPPSVPVRPVRPEQNTNTAATKQPPHTSPDKSRSPQFTLEELEEAVQDIENYMRYQAEGY